MTAVLKGVAPADGAGLADVVDDALIARLAGQARAQGVNPLESWRVPLCGFGPLCLGHEVFVVDG